MNCPECGKDFEPRTSNQRYHDAACARKAERRRARERKRKDKQVLTSLPAKVGHYDPEERDFFMRALALAGGNATQASKGLAELGFNVKPGTLNGFKRDQAERYGELRDQVAPELKARRAEAHEALADKLAHLSDALIDQLNAALENGDLKPHQLPGTLRDATVASGIHRDKAAKLRGEDIKQVVFSNPDEILARLKRIDSNLIIDSTAEEVK